MKLLILGGTVFLGRALVEAALARGHQVTLFNRGRHNPDLFPTVERLHGDRDGNLEALRGRRWDAAIDTSGYVPRLVRASSSLLAGAVDHCTFISTVSVYSDTTFAGAQPDESAPVNTLADPEIEEVTGETYGALKALCEQAAESSLPGRVLVIRPGLIVGPHDPTDRFTYWPRRVARGGEVLAPGTPEERVQVIDVRDLAEWNLKLLERGVTGTYNATGPDYALSMGRLLDECRTIGGGDARFAWVDGPFLLEQGARPWAEVPLWTGNEQLLVNSKKAVAAGLTFRPLAETIRDTLAWDRQRPQDERRDLLTSEREHAFLAAWHAH